MAHPPPQIRGRKHDNAANNGILLEGIATTFTDGFSLLIRPYRRYTTSQNLDDNERHTRQKWLGITIVR